MKTVLLMINVYESFFRIAYTFVWLSSSKFSSLKHLFLHVLRLCFPNLSSFCVQFGNFYIYCSSLRIFVWKIHFCNKNHRRFSCTFRASGYILVLSENLANSSPYPQRPEILPLDYELATENSTGNCQIENLKNKVHGVATCTVMSSFMNTILVIGTVPSPSTSINSKPDCDGNTAHGPISSFPIFEFHCCSKFDTVKSLLSVVCWRYSPLQVSYVQLLLVESLSRDAVGSGRRAECEELGGTNADFVELFTRDISGSRWSSGDKLEAAVALHVEFGQWMEAESCEKY